MTPKTLARVHRVRTLQLGLAQAEEARQRDALGQEANLRDRIGSLVAAVAPAPEASGARTLAAAAFYRDRLQQSADAAALRVQAAEARERAAAEASRAAKRDQTAVEKLLERARADALVREMRALADLPGTSGKRHGSC